MRPRLQMAGRENRNGMNETFVQDTEHDIDRDDGAAMRYAWLASEVSKTHSDNPQEKCAAGVPDLARATPSLRPATPAESHPDCGARLVLIVARETAS